MIILSILKFILLGLAFIAGFLLLVLCAALFCAVRYNVSVNKNEAVSALVKVSWLGGIVGLRYETGEDGPKSAFRLLFFRLRPKKEKPRKPGKEKKTPGPEKTLKPKLAAAAKKEKKREKRPGGFKPGEAIAQIKHYMNYPGKDEIIKCALGLLADWLRALKPKRFYLRARVGFDDPSATGKLVGLIYAALAFVPLDISVAGSFDKPEFSGSIRAWGRIRLIAFVLPLLRFIFRKPIFTIIKKYLRRRGNHGNELEQQSGSPV